jgi:hypothetical protein
MLNLINKTRKFYTTDNLSKESVHTKLVGLFTMYNRTQFHLHMSIGLFVVPLKPKVNTIFTWSSTFPLHCTKEPF